MNRKQINAAVIDAGYAEEGLLLADGFDGACLGIAVKFNTPFMVYDRDKCIEILMKRDGMSHEDAEDYFGFHVQGAYVGEHTPAYLSRFAEEVPDEKAACRCGDACACRMRKKRSGNSVGRRTTKRTCRARGVGADAAGKRARKNFVARTRKLGGRV